MAQKKISGITIEISGDTTKLDKALSAVDKEAKTTQKTLGEVNKLLKLDPTNTELLAQKQHLLGQQLDQTTQKADALREAVESHTGSNVNYDKWIKAQASIQGQITKTENSLQELRAEQQRYNDLGFETNSPQMRELQEQIDATTAKGEALRQKMQDTYDELGRPVSVEQLEKWKRELIAATQAAEDAKAAVDGFSPSLEIFGAKCEEVSSKAGQVEQAFAPVSKTIGAVAIAALATVPATEDLRVGLSMLETNARTAGVSIETAEKAFRAFNEVSGETDSSIEAVSNLLNAGFTESDLQKAVENLAGAAISFPDTLKIESLADSLQETLATSEATGQFGELLERLGVNLDTFNARLQAVTTEEAKQKIALEELSKAGLQTVYDDWVQNNQALLANRDANLELKMSTAELAEEMLPFLTKLTNLLSGLIDWLVNLPDWGKAAVVTFGSIFFAISPIAGAIKNISGAMETFGIAAKAFGINGKIVSLTMSDWIIIIVAVIAVVLLLVLALNALFGKSDDVEGMSAKSKKAASSAIPSTEDYPHFATGGVFEPNAPMLGVLGDNRTEREIAAPESTLREIFGQEMDARGGGGGVTKIDIHYSGSLAQLGRIMQPVITAETSRKGANYVTNG